MHRLIWLVVLLATTAVLVEGCGDDDGGSEPSDARRIDVTVSDDAVHPHDEELEVKVGQPIELVVMSDEPGEIRIHSSPEQQMSYRSGTSTLDVDPMAAPGQVVVDSPTLDEVIVTLEVTP